MSYFPTELPGKNFYFVRLAIAFAHGHYRAGKQNKKGKELL
jgi:hypothetical protein